MGLIDWVFAGQKACALPGFGGQGVGRFLGEFADQIEISAAIEQIEEASRIVEEAQARLKGTLAIDYVVPDYYALRPKKCMGGWGRQFFNISPSGKILPCHAAETITGLEFESVRGDHSIEIAASCPTALCDDLAIGQGGGRIEGQDRQGQGRGRTPCNRIVHIPGAARLAPGTYARVRITRGLPNSLMGELTCAAC